MNIIAVEASTQACSATLLTIEGVWTEFEMAPQKHADRLLFMVQSVLQQASLSGDDLDALAFSEGPGAFTGIRIATGVIQGLALGWEKPVIGISTLEALAWQIMRSTGQTRCVATLDARMKELYLQTCWLEDQRLRSTPAVLLNEVDAVSYCARQQATCGGGDTQSVYPQVSDAFAVWQACYPSSEAVAQLAAQRPETWRGLDENLPTPVYLRNKVAETLAERQARQASAL